MPDTRAQDALRRYIAAAIAHGAESDVDESVIPEAETLLAPIEDARDRAAARRAKSGKGGDDAQEPSDDTEDLPRSDPAPDGSD